jgi:hypothetical protein
MWGEPSVFSMSVIVYEVFGSMDSLRDHAYRIVANANKSRFEAHVGLFRLLMKGIFDPYVL